MSGVRGGARMGGRVGARLAAAAVVGRSGAGERETGVGLADGTLAPPVAGCRCAAKS